MPPTQLHGRLPNGTAKPEGAGRSKAAPPDKLRLAQSPPPVRPPVRFAPPQITAPRPSQAPNQSPSWRGGNGEYDALIVRDREPQFNRGREYAGRISSQPDPPSDGPIRPSTRMINRTWNWQVGMGAAYADDLTRGYTWVGEQGSGWTTVYGGTPGFYRAGPGGAPIGDPEQGPGRVWGGPPHGYHTMYPPDGQQTQAVARSRPQMVPARVDRLSNSRIAGQNYSQWTAPQGTTRPAGASFRGRPS